MFDKICALLAHRCYQPLRWKISLCMVPNLEYNARMTMLMDNTSSSIAFFNSTWENVVTRSPHFLVVRNSLSICAFSTIMKQTLELVASAYALVASTNVVGCLRTLDTSLVPQTAQEMCDLPYLPLCETAQLYVGTHRMRWCASPPTNCLQGSQCLLGHLGLAPLLDPVKLVGRPLGGEA